MSGIIKTDDFKKVDLTKETITCSRKEKTVNKFMILVTITADPEDIKEFIYKITETVEGTERTGGFQVLRKDEHNDGHWLPYDPDGDKDEDTDHTVPTLEGSAKL